MKLQIGKIQPVPSYSETLKVHPKGKTIGYPLTSPLSYNGFHNAKTRLTKIGYEFSFEVVKYNGSEYLQVKRIK